MDISLLIVPLNILIFMIGISLVSKCLPYLRRREVRWLVVIVASMCFISFCSLNVYIQTSFERMVLFSRFRFLGLSILAPAWMFFLVSTFSSPAWIQRKWIYAIAFGPAALTTLFTLLPSLNDLVVTNFQPFQWQGFSLVRFEGGPWFPVHFFSSMIFACGAVFYAIILGILSRGIKRKLLLTLSLGGVLSLSIDLYCVISGSPLRWSMISGSTYLLTEGAIFFGVLRYGLLDLTPLAKDTIFRSISDPVLILDKNRALLDFNPAAQGVFNLQPHQLYQSWDLVRPELKFKAGEASSEWSYVDERGHLRFFLVSVMRLNTAYSLAGEIIVLREFTERKALEQNLSNHLEFKARLLSLIAHDFSGFLQVQSTLSSNLESQVQPELRTRAGALTESVFASKDFMSNVLSWARSQENSFQPVVRSFEFNMLVKEVLQEQEPHLKMKGLQVSVESNKNPILVDGDSLMIASVFRNIITNSIRASESGQKIEIIIQALEEILEIEVKDQGCGMAMPQLMAIRQSSQEVFSNFLGTNKGFGIGLTIARRFVELHGGRFHIESQLGLGTSVNFTIPL